MAFKSPEQVSTEFYGAVAQVLRSDRIGEWSSDHNQEAKSYSGWNYLAIAALCREAARAHAYAYKDGSQKASSLRKSLKGKWGSKWKSLSQDGAADLSSEDSWVTKLVDNPSGTQTGAMFRWEYIQQMHLHGACLIFNRPTVDGTRTAARYVIPLALTQPVYPGQDPRVPDGGVKIMPYQAGLGWYVNPMISQLSGATVPIDLLSVVKYPHPFLKGDGKSPTDAAGWWVDTSMMIDQARWKQLKRGPRPYGIVMLDDDEVTETTMQLMEDRLNEKLADRNNDQRVAVVNAKGNFSTEFTPHEMDYVGSFDQMGEATLAIHGASKALVGLTDNMTYGSLAAALQQSGSVVQSDLDLLSADFTALVQSQGAREEVEHEVQPVDDPTLVESQLTTDLSAGIRTGREWRAIRGLPPFGDWRDSARVTSTGLVLDPDEPPGRAPKAPEFVARSLAKSFGRPEPDEIQPLVAIDLDGTLAEYDEFDEDYIGDPIPHGVQRVQQLKDAGVAIVIFTCREDNELLRGWLAENDVPYDAINENPNTPHSKSGKVFAHAYWDDRGVNAEDGLREIAELLPDCAAKRRLLKQSRVEGPGVIMLQVPKQIEASVQTEQDAIDAGHLVEDGFEDEPHVTLLYGVVGMTLDEVITIVRDVPQIDISFGETSYFESEEADVLKIDIESPVLHKQHERLKSALPMRKSDHDGYHPHLTLAYVESGSAQAMSGRNALTGKSARIQYATVMVDGERAQVPLRQAGA